MSWHFLQEGAAVSWAGSCLDGAPDALLKLMPTGEPSCSPGSETAPCLSSPSGTTSELLMGDCGEAPSMLLAGVSPAKTSAPLAKEQVSPAPDQASGLSLLGSFAKWNPNSSSWKTPQCSFLGGLDKFSGTWPRWGLLVDGVCWALSTPELPTAESGSGLSLPTPTASSYGNNQSASAGASVRPSLQTMAVRGLWPTPSGPSLGVAVRWPTPTATEHKRDASEGTLRRKSPPLATMAQLLPTPTVHGNYNRKGASPSSGDGLATVVGGRLNPTWVEWLMGWPLGWTDLAPLEMGRFRQWLRLHGAPLGVPYE
jgi:hypothetical protein